MTNERIQISLTSEPIPDTPAFGSGEIGAELRFLGVVRDMENERRISGIRYSAYPEMATRKMEEIAEELQGSSGFHPLIICHRIGFVAAGDASIVIAIGQPHSKEAFALLAEYLHRIKSEVPIWKEPVYTSPSS